MPLEHLGELHQVGIAVLPGNLAPLSEHLHGPAALGAKELVGLIDVLDEFGQEVQGVEELVVSLPPAIYLLPF
jgi:hypothetical protein